MPASQLRRLKASLREQGVIGPQQSKKQKKKNAQDVQAKDKRRLRKSTALENIRESFNPFQFKMNARGPKFQVTTDRPLSANAARGIKGRPGVTLSLGEQKRRDTLLVDMQRRNKVGGILDRRFGENDPTMTQEEKALERFAKEKERHYKKRSLFDLEEYEPDQSLTHLGKSLALDEDPALRDDFDEEDLLLDSDDDLSQIDPQRLKRMRGLDDRDDEDNGVPARKKSKQEVMKELVAKSKFHKYERQVEKEDDEEMRVEIDKELADIRPLLYAPKPSGDKEKANGQPSQPHLVAGVDKIAFDAAYDLRVRQMIQDRRAQPTDRTKTDEEIAEEEAARLKELEAKRMKRMRGEQETDDEDGEEDEESEEGSADDAFSGDGEDDEFGLGKGVRTRPTATQLGFDDEDDFFIDDDLVASGSELELEDAESDEGEAAESEDDDDEFTKGLLTESESKNPAFAGSDDDGAIPFTFPCPQSHQELLEVASGLSLAQLPTVVQRIRALYHPKLDAANKERLGNFACVLVKHIAFLGNAFEPDTFPVVEALIRHTHSLAKGFPIEVAKEFRSHLLDMETNRPLGFTTGDLVILTAVGTIFPTSDHFHQVVTPAALAMARFLGQKVPRELEDFSIGTYLLILFIQYQQLAKRYVPEVMNFSINTMMALAPVECRGKVGFVPIHPAGKWSRINGARDVKVRKLNFADCSASEPREDGSALAAKVAILSTTIAALATAAEIWMGKPAFFETFAPVSEALKHLKVKQCRSQLPDALNQEIERASALVERQLQMAHLSRRPLELHHHRPMAIRTFIPKFEDSFDPYKHYDPNRERAESAKLKAEHRKERKGAMRELRKDANFMAREKLRSKKAKDEAYEKKYKRLVAEIQGEEGREANEYEREKVSRKRAKHR